MISTGTVGNDSNTLENSFSSYKTAMDGASQAGIWEGQSRDNAVAKTQEFVSSFENPLLGQFSSFSAAVTSLNNYKEARRYHNAYSYNYDLAVQYNKPEDATKYMSLKNQYGSLMASYKNQVTSHLSQVTAVRLTAAKSEFVMFYQTDYNQSYNYGTTISSSGCGPTSMAMVATYLLGEVHDPVEMAQWSMDHGYRRYNAGTSPGFFPAVSKAYGIDCQKVSSSSASIVEELRKGRVLICAAYNGGHYLVLRGLDSDGRVIMADPYYKGNNTHTWNPSDISCQTTMMWSFDVS